MNANLRLLFFVVYLIISCQGITEFHCTNSNSSATYDLVLKCPPNLFINVKEALYGRSQWNECRFFVGDCTESFNIDTQCCGRNDCTLALRRVYSIKCSGYVSFFRVIYECQTAEQSTCSVKDTNFIGSDTASTKDTWDPLSPTSPDVVLPASYTESVPKDVYIIIGSAATVAFLLAAIVTVIFFLKKYQWHGEKQCILKLFVGLCKRHPPDGCENPEDITKGKDTEPTTSNINQIATVSSLLRPNAVQERVSMTTDVQKSSNYFKNTTLYGILKEVTRGKTTCAKKVDFVAAVDVNKHVCEDIIYSEPFQDNNGNSVCHEQENNRSEPDETRMFTDV